MNQENNTPINQDNTDKEAGNSTNSKDDTDTSAVYFGDSKMQTKEEFEQSQKIGHTKEDNEVTSSGGNDDLRSNNDGAAGTDRAGTAERKMYGDTELNKGLEAQAQDEEI